MDSQEPAVASPKPPTDMREAVDRAARGIGKLTRLVAVRTELARLPALMLEDEVPDVVVSGIQGYGWGLLVATNKRVMWVNKGIVTYRVEDIAYDTITTVNAKTGIVGGEVELRYYESWRITNYIPNPDVHRIADAIRARMRAPRDLLAGA